MALPTTKNGSINYRSNLLHFVGLYGTIKEYVKVGHNIHMKATPFWRLYRAYRDKLMTAKHFSALDNDVVDRVTKTKIEVSLRNVVAGRSNEERLDFARLMCLYFCNTLLLCNSSTQILWKLMGICEKLDQIQTYNWAMTIAECLNKSLVHMPVLYFWFGGKTRLLTPIVGRENKLPNFVSWSLVQLYKTLINMDLKTLAYDEDDALSEIQIEIQADDPIKQDEDEQINDVLKDAGIVVVAHLIVPISPILHTPTSKSIENNIKNNMCSVKTRSSQFEAPTWDIVPS
ncbi:hypothetical protein ACFX11_040780 [Malus domestica]